MGPLRSAFVDPIFLGLFTALIGLAAATRWRRAGTAVCLAALLALWALSTPYLADRFSALVEPTPAAHPDPGALSPQAIVILSASLHRNTPELGGDTANQESLERTRYGARLAKSMGLPILVSGGPGFAATKTYAETMADALRDDFSSNARWVESRSRTTYENALFSKEMLARDGIGTIYLVTHARHMPRAAAVFRSVGFAVVPAPTYFTSPAPPTSLLQFIPCSDSLRRSWVTLREVVGRPFYRVVYDAPAHQDRRTSSFPPPGAGAAPNASPESAAVAGPPATIAR